MIKNTSNISLLKVEYFLSVYDNFLVLIYHWKSELIAIQKSVVSTWSDGIIFLFNLHYYVNDA